jgi:hypothetical protein
MNSNGCCSIVILSLIQRVQRMIHRLSGLGSLDGGHGLRVGQNLHLLQKAGHPLARHNESHHFAIPGYGGSLSPPAQGGKLRLPLRHGQRILHSELYIDHFAQNGKPSFLLEKKAFCPQITGQMHGDTEKKNSERNFNR